MNSADSGTTPPSEITEAHIAEAFTRWMEAMAATGADQPYEDSGEAVDSVNRHAAALGIDGATLSRHAGVIADLFGEDPRRGYLVIAGFHLGAISARLALSDVMT